MGSSCFSSIIKMSASRNIESLSNESMSSCLLLTACDHLTRAASRFMSKKSSILSFNYKVILLLQVHKQLFIRKHNKCEIIYNLYYN